MLGLLRDVHSNEARAIHRTALRADGQGKGDLSASKMMLGPAAGCVVKLIDDADVTLGLGIAEGIENALTAICCGWRPVWACASAGALEHFPVLSGVEALTIFADADERGLQAAEICGVRWIENGGEVTIVEPKRPGADLNDLLGGLP